VQSSTISNNDFDGRFSETVHPATGETDRRITHNITGQILNILET
jgi:hypothetical protein